MRLRPFCALIVLFVVGCSPIPPVLENRLKIEGWHRLEYTPDGTRFVSLHIMNGRVSDNAGGETSLRIWDAETLMPLSQLSDSGQFHDFAISSDGSRLYLACAHAPVPASPGSAPWPGYGEVRVWNPVTYEEFPSLPFGEVPLNLALSPSGRYLAITGTASGAVLLHVWDMHGEPHRIHTVSLHKGLSPIVFLDENTLVHRDGCDVVRMDIGSGHRIVIRSCGFDHALQISLMRDPECLAIVTNEGDLRFCDRAGNPVTLSIDLPNEFIASITPSPDRKWCAVQTLTHLEMFRKCGHRWEFVTRWERINGAMTYRPHDKGFVLGEPRTIDFWSNP